MHKWPASPGYNQFCIYPEVQTLYYSCMHQQFQADRQFYFLRLFTLIVGSCTRLMLVKKNVSFILTCSLQDVVTYAVSFTFNVIIILPRTTGDNLKRSIYAALLIDFFCTSFSRKNSFEMLFFCWQIWMHAHKHLEVYWYFIFLIIIIQYLYNNNSSQDGTFFMCYILKKYKGF